MLGRQVDMNFDYQEWASLAENDPEAFELRRVQYIDQFLGNVGKHRQRLEGLQFRIDAARRLAHTSPMALLAISKLMIMSLAELSDDLATLERLVHGECGPVVPADKEALPCKVLRFPPRCGDLREVLVTL